MADSRYTRTWHPAASSILAYFIVFSTDVNTLILHVMGTFRFSWQDLTGKCMKQNHFRGRESDTEMEIYFLYNNNTYIFYRAIPR